MKAWDRREDSNHWLKWYKAENKLIELLFKHPDLKDPREDNKDYPP